MSRFEYVSGSIATPDFRDIPDPKVETVLRGQWVNTLVRELNEQIVELRELGATVLIQDDYGADGNSRVVVEISQEI